jgi:hypothetical protein
MVVENKYYFYVVVIRNKIKHINNIQEMELHTKKWHKWISSNLDYEWQKYVIQKIQKHISSNLDYEWQKYVIQNFIVDE